MRSRPPPGRPRGRAEVVSTEPILGGRDPEAALADHPAVSVLGARPLTRPDLPAFLCRLEPIPLPVEAPLGLELQSGLPRPLAQDLLAVSEELDVVVASTADGSPLEQRRPPDSGTRCGSDEVPVRSGGELPAR